jgi:hypothetical protein
MTEKLMNIQDAWDDQIRHTHDAATQGHRTLQRYAQQARFARRAMQMSTGLVCLWSVLETPWEWMPADDPTRVAALVASKCLLLGAGTAAILGVRYARAAFAFVCGASVLTVSSTLPFVYGISHPLFTLALAECVLKAAVVMSCALWYMGKASSQLDRQKKAR